MKLRGDWGGEQQETATFTARSRALLRLRHSVVRQIKPPCYDFDNKLKVTTLINWESLGVEMHG